MQNQMNVMVNNAAATETNQNRVINNATAQLNNVATVGTQEALANLANAAAQLKLRLLTAQSEALSIVGELADFLTGFNTMTLEAPATLVEMIPAPTLQIAHNAPETQEPTSLPIASAVQTESVQEQQEETINIAANPHSEPTPEPAIQPVTSTEETTEQTDPTCDQTGTQTVPTPKKTRGRKTKN